jgi:hypothetical protein
MFKNLFKRKPIKVLVTSIQHPDGKVELDAIEVKGYGHAINVSNINATISARIKTI